MGINLDFKNNIKPKKGILLISNPELKDNIFNRSVVLICEHDETGTIGFIVNKKSLTDVSEAMPDLEQLSNKLYYGGPVDLNGVYMLHTCSNIPNCIHIKDDLYYGGDMKEVSTLSNIMQIDVNDIHFLLGYSSWIPNQLDFEIQRKSWVVLEDFDEDFIFNTPEDQMWSAALRKMGNEYKIFANYPMNPNMN